MLQKYTISLDILEMTVMLEGYMKTTWNSVMAKLVGTSSSTG
jgi:hypothetical protein